MYSLLNKLLYLFLTQTHVYGPCTFGFLKSYKVRIHSSSSPYNLSSNCCELKIIIIKSCKISKEINNTMAIQSQLYLANKNIHVITLPIFCDSVSDLDEPAPTNLTAVFTEQSLLATLNG